MRFNTKLQTIFLDPHSEYDEITTKVNVILSPSLYWVKKMALPVKYEREAKKLLPSIFEDILPEGSYSYAAYKSGEEFLIFAYSDKLILETLSQKGIALSNVANVYFAQSEIKDIEGALKINEMQSIYMKDGLLILVPCCWIEEKGALDLTALKHSNHSITLAQFGHIVDNRSIFKIAAILMVLILLVSTEYFITTQKASSLTALKEELFDKYELKSTMFQNQALLKKYRGIHSTQSRVREVTSYFLALKLKSGENITLINLKNRKMTVNFSGVKQGSEKHITSFLNSKGLLFKSSFAKEIMQVEVSL